MRKVTSVFLFIFVIQSAFAQGTWTQLADIPSTGRHHACAFVLGDSAYIVTGSNTDDFFKYDIHADSWTQLANFPGGNRTYSIGFSVNGKGYFSCGYDGSTANMEMWEYDPILDTWIEKTSGPAIGRIHPAFSVVGDRVYLGQGQQNGTFADLGDWYEYNTVTDVWTQKTSFMSPRHHGAGATVGNTIYVGTGHHLDTMFSDWYAYDASADSWQTMTDFPAAGRSAANSVSANGKVYFFGGEDEINFARFDDFWEYDPANDTWGSLTTFPADGRWAPFMFAHNDTIYVGAGQDEVTVDRKDLWRFDFSSVGIDEEVLPVISVFPNPSNSGYFKTNASMEIEKVDIIDALGRSFSVPYDANNQQVNASGLSSGKYIMRISFADQHVMNKNVPIIILK